MWKLKREGTTTNGNTSQWDERLAGSLPEYVRKNLEPGSKKYAAREQTTALALAAAGLFCVYGTYLTRRAGARPVADFLRDKQLHAIIAAEGVGFVGPNAGNIQGNIQAHHSTRFSDGLGLWVPDPAAKDPTQKLPYQPLPANLDSLLPAQTLGAPGATLHGHLLRDQIAPFDGMTVD